MAENGEFIGQLQEAVNQKIEWFNTIRLQELLSQYRILQSCVKNLYDMLVKKTLIIPDPYRIDKKISEITVPETSSFTENEAMSVLGSRFSEYEVMLDYICTYYRFSVENLTIPKIKNLLEFNKVFEWENFSSNSAKANTRFLAGILNNAKTNSPNVIISMINDSLEKNAIAGATISRVLNELGVFQKELYKVELRNDLFNHPDFKKEQAFTSPEAEMAEIKRLYPKVLGKKPFYTDLINEIIQEDIGPNKDKLRENVLRSLKIPAATSSARKKVVKIDYKEMLMETVLCLSAISPILTQLKNKLTINFDLAFQKKKNFFRILGAALKKVFHLKEKEKVCPVSVTDPRTGATRVEKVKVNELLIEMAQKERVYGAIATKGAEYKKIESYTEEVILQYVNKQISENQSLFSIVNALDTYFKNAVDVMLRSKVKGLQIDLAGYRNAIITANKKRGDYVSSKEEAVQMEKLGIKDDASI